MSAATQREPHAGAAGNELSTDRAVLLVEILSPSRVRIDFNDKLAEYKAVAACKTYLIFDRDVPRAWQWSRVDGVWSDPPEIIETLDKCRGQRARVRCSHA